MVAPPHVDSNSLFIVHANSVCREAIKAVFPNENIRVSYFNEEVNVRDLLKWLTDEFEDKDFVTVFEDQMIQPHWDLLLKMAGGGVNVYNKDTWSSDVNTMNYLTCSIDGLPLNPPRVRRLKIISRWCRTPRRITKAKHVVRG